MQNAVCLHDSFKQCGQLNFENDFSKNWTFSIFFCIGRIVWFMILSSPRMHIQLAYLPRHSNWHLVFWYN